MKHICILILTVIIWSSSCSLEKESVPSGTWINPRLDFITFSNDSIELGHTFFPSETFAYRVKDDSIEINSRTSFGDPGSNSGLTLHYALIDSVTMYISSNQVGGYFGGSANDPMKFYKRDDFFKQRDWDSLVVLKYEQFPFGTDEALLERIQITNTGTLILKTKLIDALGDGAYRNLAPLPDWDRIHKQISEIDSSCFRLYQGEVSHALGMSVEIYGNDGVQTFAGYAEIPMIFKELRNLLCCDYSRLRYTRDQ